MERINLMEYIPARIVSGKHSKEYDLVIEKEYSDAVLLSYISDINRKYSKTISKFISNGKETCEVLGLLQAEMGKTQNGCIVFANSEPRLINKVVRWFEKEFCLIKNTWRWIKKVVAILFISVHARRKKDLSIKKL